MSSKKKKNTQAIKINIKPCIIAIAQWLLTTIFQVDRLFFSYDQVNRVNVTVKLIYLIFLIIAWYFIFEVIERVRSGDEKWKRGLFIFTVYFSIMLVFMLILWPGTWSWDDTTTINRIATYNTWYPWQHFITGLYLDVLLQILPFPGGIILLQNVIISICVAFVVTKLEYTFNLGRVKIAAIDVLIKLIPFLLPPVLMYQFSGYRMGLYLYLELVMIVMLIGAWKDEKEWSIKYSLLFSSLCVIVSCWRTEAFMYIPIACILIHFVKKPVISHERKELCIATLIIGFFCLSRIQSMLLGNSDYNVISLMRPCVELVRNADAEKDKEELEAIDKVADLQIIYDNPTENGENLYWNTGCVRTRNDDPGDNYSSEDYSSFIKALVRLSLKYPAVIIKERTELFLCSCGVKGNYASNVALSADRFEPENNGGILNDTSKNSWKINQPLLHDARISFINFLGFRNKDGSYKEWIRRIVWNAIIPILVLIVGWIIMLIKKEWYYAAVLSAILIKLPMIILTQPGGWFMYMLSFYFLGYVLLVYGVLIFWGMRSRVSLL